MVNYLILLLHSEKHAIVQMEKQKQVMTRAIGENKQKVDPRFLKAIADARRAQEQAHMQQQAQSQENLLTSDEVDNPEVMEQRR